MPAKRIAGALEEALRATDLLLQGGGFSVIVMDLGNVPAEMAWRVPMATWFRFRAACEQTQASLVLLTQHPCARSSAEVVVRMGAATMQAECRVMSGVVFHAETERQRFEQGDKVVSIRKHPQPERGRGAGWRGAAAWAVGR
jgi:recombination protein RecA